MKLGYPYNFFSGADIRWWFLKWGDNNWWTQRNTRIWHFVFLLFFLFVSRLFDNLTRFFFLFLSGVFTFFFNTKKVLFFLFHSFFFVETKSTWLIQLHVAGSLGRGLKIYGNLLLVVFDFHKCIHLVYVDVCYWFHWSHVLWIMVWCLLKANRNYFRYYLLQNSLLAGVWNRGVESYIF